MEKKEESILRYFEHIDWLMMLPVFSMLIVGLLLIFSATLRTGNAWSYIVRQGFGMLIGAGFLLIIATVDYRIYRQYFTHIYFLSVILLVAVLIIGKTYRGTKGWIDLGYLSFQPSELTKIFFILSIAGYLDKFTKEIHIWQKLIIPVLMLSGNIIPILIQPDFSSTLVYFAIFLG
ncbi:MAG: FtsW/RodA/SpoVE family cell cycle protein, partial [Elusimicrobiota bacterium]